MRLHWCRVEPDVWEGYDQNDIVRAEVRREGAAYRWVVLDGYSDSTGTAQTARRAMREAQRRTRPTL